MASTSSAPAKKSSRSVAYENNPFKVGLDGINLVMNKARNVGILLIVLSVLSFGSNFMQRTKDSGQEHATAPGALFAQLSPTGWIILALVMSILILAFVFVSAMLSGIGAYTSARLARGHEVTLSEAFHAVLDRFFSYIWLQIIQTVKLILWTLLFIIPGIIMSVRYSMANVVFFDKGLTGNAAIKDSIKVTRGAWITTYASYSLFNFITLGIIGELVTAGARSILYRQLTQFKEGEAKPEAHILSWVTLLLPFALIGLLILFVILFVGFVAMIGGGTYR